MKFSKEQKHLLQELMTQMLRGLPSFDMEELIRHAQNKSHIFNRANLVPWAESFLARAEKVHWVKKVDGVYDYPVWHVLTAPVHGLQSELVFKD
jgi:hypothetical protein